MKKYTRTQRVLLALVGLTLVLTIALNAVKENAIYQTVKGQTYSFFSTMRYTLIDQPIQAVVNLSSDLTSFWKLRDENDQLKKDLESYQAKEAQLAELQRNYNELKDLLGLKETYNQFQLVNASVTTRDLNSWANTVTINVGTDDGLGAGNEYAVMTSKGVIGKTLSIGKASSTVTLFTANDMMNQASVRIQVSQGVVVDGILNSYDANSGEFVLTIVGDASAIQVNNHVITSGLGGIYPTGLSVGSVSRIETSSDANSIRIYVTPSADFDNFDYVSVVIP